MADSPQPLPPPPVPGRECALFLDVDGTLIDFAPRPDAVCLRPGLIELLDHLGNTLGGALALVSGRPVEQLDALFAPLRLPAAGLHGHQLRPADVTMPIAPADVPDGLHALHEQAERLAHAHPGVLVEDKHSGLALHWRNAPGAAEAVTAFAQAQLHALPGFRLQPGNEVIEFVPLGSDKGRAVQTLMTQAPFAGRMPVFVGDDLTDEAGFAAANRIGGWSVLVGARAGSLARHALPDIGAVLDWLRTTASQEESRT